MNTKFELMTETGNGLFRIRAKTAFGAVKAGELGGFIEKETNLAASGNAWVSGDALVYGNAQVSGDAQVYGNARVSSNARVSDNALVSGDARVSAEGSWMLVGPIGSRCAFLSVHADAKLKVRYTTGCFSGSRKQFMAAVRKTHRAGTLYRKQYEAALLMTKLVKGG